MARNVQSNVMKALKSFQMEKIVVAGKASIKGSLNRFRLAKKTGKLSWSGRIRHCKRPEDNRRILEEEQKT